jgi:hypothetical protein
MNEWLDAAGNCFNPEPGVSVLPNARACFG